jgi:hypothetical protein
VETNENCIMRQIYAKRFCLKLHYGFVVVAYALKKKGNVHNPWMMLLVIPTMNRHEIGTTC